MIHEIPEAVKILEPVLKRKRLILFAGSGISIDPPSNLPLWDGLVREFLVFCSDIPDELRDKEFDELLEAAKLDPGKHPERIASSLVIKLQEIENERYDIKKALRQWMTDRFYSGEPNDNHHAILSTDFRS